MVSEVYLFLFFICGALGGMLGLVLGCWVLGV